jgi:uncharacterized membrane protein
VLYLFKEVFFKALTGQMVVFGFHYQALNGFTSLWMFPIGALCGILIGLVSEAKVFEKLPFSILYLVGAFLVLIIEFASGFVLNIVFKLNLWDYSKLPFNFLGQVCLLFGIFWYFITPFAVWMGKFLRWCLFDEVVTIEPIWVTYRKAFLVWEK